MKINICNIIEGLKDCSADLNYLKQGLSKEDGEVKEASDIEKHLDKYINQLKQLIGIV